jgi:hypothetical protein
MLGTGAPVSCSQIAMQNSSPATRGCRRRRQPEPAFVVRRMSVAAAADPLRADTGALRQLAPPWLTAPTNGAPLPAQSKAVTHIVRMPARQGMRVSGGLSGRTQTGGISPKRARDQRRRWQRSPRQGRLRARPNGRSPTATPGPVNTRFAGGVVHQASEPSRFRPEDGSLGVALVLARLVAWKSGVRAWRRIGARSRVRPSRRARPARTDSAPCPRRPRMH